MGLTQEELAAFVKRSCEAQGVPLKVTDARVIDDVAALLAAGTGGAWRQPGHARPDGLRAAS